MTEAISPDASECTVCHLPIAAAVQVPDQRHACPFCRRKFSRVDGARRHAKSCPRKGGRPLPPEAKRGRKLRACDRCSRVKAHCDGKQPCGHCSSRQLECSFRRFCSDGSHRQAVHDVTLWNTCARGRSSVLSFLFNFTDPAGESVMEREIAGEPESNIIRGSAARKPSPLHQDFDFGTCIDPALLFTSFMDPCLEADLENDMFGNEAQDAPGGLSTILTPPTDVLAVRITQLSAELEEFALAKPQYGAFDRASFDELFTSARVHQASSTLSRKRHFQFPLIHWPTFDLEQACLPLLAAISLTGAAYSHRSGHRQGQDDDVVRRTREYYPIAAAYILRRLKRCVDAVSAASDSTDSSEEAIEHLQAALLVVVLEICLNDGDMRRAITSKRLPTLVAAIRIFGFVGTRHDWSEDWECFVRRESRVRLVSWIFFIDCLTTVFCNKPPLMSFTEVHGHLPCSQTVWDADSACGFSARRVEEEAQVGFLCLDDLTAGLLRDEWSGAAANPYDRLSFHHLNAIICALQPVIFNLHTSPLPNTPSHVLLRALDRWQLLWDAVTVRVAPDQRRWLGVERNSPGLALLSRRAVELNGTEAGRTSKYLQRFPTHDFSDIHGFIKDYCC